MAIKFPPYIPIRLQIAIEKELNHPYSIIYVPPEFQPLNVIPAWLIIMWIDSGIIKRLPNIGKKTINDTIQAIADNMKM